MTRRIAFRCERCGGIVATEGGLLEVGRAECIHLRTCPGTEPATGPDTRTPTGPPPLEVRDIEGKSL